MNPSDRLFVDDLLYTFVERELLADTGIPPTRFWAALEAILIDFRPKNLELLKRRDDLQAQIDTWWKAHRDQSCDVAEETAFLRDIGYLLPEPPDFVIGTGGVDPEIAEVAGPQLVVPVSNARYALNAANARWGSLYDALYGTDALQAPLRDEHYDPARGAKVVAYVRAFLDHIAPLTSGSHAEAVAYVIASRGLTVQLQNGSRAVLRRPDQLVGWRGAEGAPGAVLLEHHGLHVEIQIDKSHEVARHDPAGVADVLIEAALTAIHDCEDSVAAVDAADKVLVYRNWLGLMKGDLEVTFEKNGQTQIRRLEPDRAYRGPRGQITLRGRSLMLVRNVGHHVMTDMVRLGCEPVFETAIDGLVTVAAALHDIRGGRQNSRAGSIYVVKPKLHGPDEVALAVRLLSQVEQALNLPPNAIKIGLMDEERRTSANLKACVHAARERVVFINTGFLDRTGDEIHTAMEAGPVMRKDSIKAAPWLRAYEMRNVEIGLLTGFRGRGQIGKGMWAAPDMMKGMLLAKVSHPRAGANTAWVPSPTAAVLHALHYHQIDVRLVQNEMVAAGAKTGLDELLIPPLTRPNWNPTDVQEELDNNVQGILGYVVRWIDQGVGCSKVPDIHGVALMEDRATLRISSQHIANWLRHAVCTERQVRETFARMAEVVDAQNAGDPAYVPMASNPEAPAFQAALELVFRAREQPNGYTESILARRRRERKALAARGM